MMMRSALRDLQWRHRRVLIAVFGTALVFSITLVLSGVSHGFDVETDRTMAKFRSDGWIVRDGAAGPFIGQAPLPGSTVEAVRSETGITDANAVVFSRKTVGLGSPKEVNLFGVERRGVAVPAVDRGRAPRESGEIVVSTRLHYGIGDKVLLSGKPFRVVGTISNSTVVAGVPNVLVTLTDAQTIAFVGQPIISAVAVKGTPRAVPPGTRFMNNADARRDLLRAVSNARSGIDLIGLLLWLVAATIIGSVIYLSALERAHDFAVFKATGTSSATILADLVVQAVLLSLVAAGFGVLVATLIGPRFPVPVVIPVSSLLLLPTLAVAVGLLASLAGLRRAITVDPAIAFTAA
jgi:putative ABC transport system permease protein